MTSLPNDHAARERIKSDLRTNILVEAGAGSGKTTSLVRRMLEHIRTGTRIDQLAAVTFTRKAASELRERFQIALEEVVQGGGAAPEELERYREALRGMDRAYLGTIHGFCARLLRERPLEVAIDPAFQEVSGEDWVALRQQFWWQWVERAKREGDPELAEVARVGIDPQDLVESFDQVTRYPDVDFPLVDTPPPDIAGCRGELERLLDDATSLMPTSEPADGWDPLMRFVRRMSFRRRFEDWTDVATFCAAVGSIPTSQLKLTQKRWSATKDGKTRAKAMAADLSALVDGQIADVLRRWREHCYPVVMRLLLRAAQEFAQHRRSTGMLGFEDLLLLTARLLREHPATRDEFGARYSFLLIDEFQDTDPVQAEVCLLLASDSSQGNDWRTVTPRPGSLFVVGDPKQSIYRFRRADIQVYEFVKRRFEAFGGCVLELTANFRSNDAIGGLVNRYFPSVFPVESTQHQAAFAAMDTATPTASAEGVFRHIVRFEGRGNQSLLALDATRIATWIDERIERRERTAGDFLILTPQKLQIERYARALAERNIPVSTTGAPLPQEYELRELLVVLRAIADPENPIAVAAALEGLFFGLSPADLWSAVEASLRFAITHPPTDQDHQVGRALMRLHEWWRLSRRHPADVLMERILDDTGLLLHAASQSLGDARAGALMHLIESLRIASVSGTSAIADAMQRLEVLLASDTADAPLQPGRSDAVRVMNLHKAKGLEATVVILAAPIDEKDHDPVIHVVRSDDGRAIGAMCLWCRNGNATRVLAHPPGWSEASAAEEEFARAERERLRYVAVTRAKRELLVSQGLHELKSGPTEDASIWRPLGGALADVARELTLHETPPPGRQAVHNTLDELRRREVTVHERIATASIASVTKQTVTERAKEEPDAGGDERERRGGGRGVAWGRAVHRAIEAHGRGRSGATLRAFTLAVGHDEGLSTAECEDLARVIEEVEASQVIGRMRSSGELRMELTVMQSAREGERVVVTEGVLDAAALTPEGWEVVDWKSDAVAGEEWLRRIGTYDRQVSAYCDMLAALTGREASGVVRRIGGEA